MVNATIDRAMRTIERRSEDLRGIFRSGSEPNYAELVRAERVETVANALSVVPPDAAYFLAGEPSRPLYTRSGTFALRDGELVDESGRAILGFASSDASGVPQPLRVEHPDALLGRVEDAKIDPDGLFSYARSVIDPQTLESTIERVSVGRVALARFPAGTRLDRTDEMHARGPERLSPLVGTPADGTFTGLLVRSRAIGRLDPDAAIERLQDAYLAARALGAVERTHNGMVRGAFDLVK